MRFHVVLKRIKGLQNVPKVAMCLVCANTNLSVGHTNVTMVVARLAELFAEKNFYVVIAVNIDAMAQSLLPTLSSH